MIIYITYDDNTLFGTEVVYNTGGVGAVSVRCQCRCRCGGGGGCSVLPPLVPTVAALVDDGGGLIGRPGLHLHEVGVAMGALWADDLCLVTLLHVLLGQHEVVPLLLQGNLIGDLPEFGASRGSAKSGSTTGRATRDASCVSVRVIAPSR